MGGHGLGMGIRLSPAPEFDFETPLKQFFCVYTQKSGSNVSCYQMGEPFRKHLFTKRQPVYETLWGGDGVYETA